MRADKLRPGARIAIAGVIAGTVETIAHRRHDVKVTVKHPDGVARLIIPNGWDVPTT